MTVSAPSGRPAKVPLTGLVPWLSISVSELPKVGGTLRLMARVAPPRSTVPVLTTIWSKSVPGLMPLTSTVSVPCGTSVSPELTVNTPVTAMELEVGWPGSSLPPAATDTVPTVPMPVRTAPLLTVTVPAPSLPITTALPAFTTVPPS